MVLSPDKGGVFDVLLGLVRKGLGGTAGPGNQFFSWIDDLDFLRAIEFLITNEKLEGPINVCSPNPIPNREFMRELRKAWGAPVGLPTASWMLAIGALFMRTETELVLKSRRVVPGRLLKEGFQFNHPDWPSAAQDLVRRWRELRSKPRA
jgi:NAD dependent epimerase/dehydratase family enzyme